jgi:hypothetical protein
VRTALNQNCVELHGRRSGETELALKFIVHKVGGKVLPELSETWFPFSQVQSITRAAPGSDELDVLVVNSWIAGKKGLV